MQFIHLKYTATTPYSTPKLSSSVSSSSNLVGPNEEGNLVTYIKLAIQKIFQVQLYSYAYNFYYCCWG